MGYIYTGVVRMMLGNMIPHGWQSPKEDGWRRPTVLDVAIRELGRCVI